MLWGKHLLCFWCVCIAHDSHCDYHNFYIYIVSFFFFACRLCHLDQKCLTLWEVCSRPCRRNFFFYSNKHSGGRFCHKVWTNNHKFCSWFAIKLKFRATLNFFFVCSTKWKTKALKFAYRKTRQMDFRWINLYLWSIIEKKRSSGFRCFVIDDGKWWKYCAIIIKSVVSFHWSHMQITINQNFNFLLASLAGLYELFL